ncbi:uncharacterized protein LOC110462969 [Mizuhopecten yessoensis]|uniref:G-protein coupled receptor 153 n=1 Tax=Mizuhopecten yessoensis TaxID=6573 RepID=A0A210PX88_MIZYE|nr:uncharacterized protein LOC110462969 [Mizuhopecten yessoensis]XP_021372936.1 uncharacterized protein LOC110462969 [Mizuhopecten yessoensis]OWF41103.1 G-protein coupled receptor 153 [Mizuhopecten yessoensis]
MSEFVINVLWLVLSPLAGVTGVITAVVIAHYTPFYHGSDILLFSYAITMSINSLLLPSVPALVEITGNTWPDILCQFYVWAFITFRVLQVLTLLSLSVLWSAIMKYSTRGKRIKFTTIVKGVVPTIWVLSAVLGLLPIIGAVPDTFHSEGKCHFLSSDLGQGMAVTMGVIVFSCVVFSVICVCDATVLLKYVRRVALVKYGAGRFYLPQKRSSVPGAGTYTIHERYHQLTFAWDVCRLVLVWVLGSGLVSHIPYAVLEFVALTSPPGSSHKTIKDAIIWLVLVEALCLPHLLWIVSTRYRHAFIYIWRVRVLRKPAEEEEDSAACTLKSYLRTAQQLNGTGTRQTPSNSLPRRQTDEPIDGHSHNNRQLPLTDISTIVRQQNQRYRQRPDNSPDPQASACAATSGPLHQQREVHSQTVPQVHRALSAASSRSSPASQKRNISSRQQKNQITYLDTGKEVDLTRSASSSSRHDWKDQMRKKHLPPIFVNEAFDSGEANRVRSMQQVATQSHAREDSSSLHFYLSGDYHPDYLNTDSLPRKHHLLEERSESEGVSGQYDDGDIAIILDEKLTAQTNVEVHNTRPHLSSFKAVQSNKHSGSSSVARDNEVDNLSNSNLPDVISNGLKSTDNSDYETDTIHDTYRHHVRNSSHASSHVKSEGSGSRASFDDVDVSDLLADSSRTANECRTDGDGDARTDLYKAEEIALDLSYSEPSHSYKYDDNVIEVFSPQPDIDLYKSDGSEKSKFDESFVCRKLSDSSSRASSYVSRENKHTPTFDHSGRLTTSYQCRTDNRTSHVYMADCNDRRRVDSPRSGTSTPLSFTFDPEIDRGFEEALSVGCPGTPSVCDTIPGFDSVTEGSEDGSSVFPVDYNVSLEEDPFRTHAVVSKSLSDTHSTGSSENPFDCLPSLRYGNTYPNKYSELIEKTSSSPVSDIMVNSTSEADHGDSGFNSGLESSVVVHQGSNIAFAGGSQEATPTRQSSSPWPEDVLISPNEDLNTEHCFENDFSGNRSNVVSSILNTHDTEAVYF